MVNPENQREGEDPGVADPPLNDEAEQVAQDLDGLSVTSGNSAGSGSAQEDPEVTIPPSPPKQPSSFRPDPLAKFSIGQNIKELGSPDGSNRKKLLVWIRALEGLGEEALRYALHTARGRLKQFLDSQTELTWLGTKPLVIRKFLGPDFADEQLSKLLNITQSRDQSIPEYVQEVEYLVTEAFGSTPDAMIPTIVNALVKGLSNPRLVQCVREKNPRDLDEAIDLIDRYQHIVPAPKPSRISTIDDLTDLKHEILRELKPLTSQAAPVAPPTPSKPTECYVCGKTGHFARECPAKAQPKPEYQCFRCGNAGHRIKDCPQPVQAPQSKCERCMQVGHVAQDCRTGPPKKPCRVCNQPHWRYDCPKQSPASGEKPKNG